jgi:hypothetical protein
MDASVANAIKGRAPLRASGTLRSALKKRGKSTGTLSYFYSAKNDRDIVLATDLELCSALDLEADENVRSFDTDAARIAAVMEGYGAGRPPDVLVVRRDGSMCLRHVGYRTAQRASRAQERQQVRAAVACEPEIAREWFTEETVRHRDRLIHDWLLIAPVLHETHWRLAACWPDLMRDVLGAVASGPCTLGALRQSNLESWALVFSAAWRLTQLGELRSNLAQLPLSADTTFTLGERYGS